jgi:hypothetical protein
MENIIPQNINDKFNVLFKYVNNLYESFVNLTANYFIIDENLNQVSITGDTFTINTNDGQINLGSQSDPDVYLLHTTNHEDITDEDTAPDGSFYLSNDNYGEAYLKINDKWININTLDTYRLNDDKIIDNETSIFGESNKIILAPEQIYEIEYNIYFTKNISNNTLKFIINYDNIPNLHIIHCDMDNQILNETNSATINSETIKYSCKFYNPQYDSIEITTKNIDEDEKNYICIKLYITNGELENNVDLLLDGEATILQNSNWISKKISP